MQSKRHACHLQRFGTILALCCMSSETADGTEVLQMLQAEGYDTALAADSRDAITQFGAREVGGESCWSAFWYLFPRTSTLCNPPVQVFPDVVLVDADLPAFSSTAYLVKQLQAQNTTVAIVVLGKAGGAIAALQSGAADYMASGGGVTSGADGRASFYFLHHLSHPHPRRAGQASRHGRAGRTHRAPGSEAALDQARARKGHG